MTREEARVYFARQRGLLLWEPINKAETRLAHDAYNLAIEALRSPWVRTAERLPDVKADGFWMLAAYEDGEIDMVDAPSVAPGGYTHWMPIPPLPEEEG